MDGFDGSFYLRSRIRMKSIKILTMVMGTTTNIIVGVKKEVCVFARDRSRKVSGIERVDTGTTCQSLRSFGTRFS